VSNAAADVELRYSKRAQRDLLDNSIGWRVHHPGRADLFDEEISKAMSLLATQPRMGRRVREHKNARVLSIIATGHLVFYRVHRSYLMVLAVLPARAQRAAP
jgi:plasmid stabilization system protein ParE